MLSMTTPFLLGWPGGSMESTLKLVGLVLLAYAIVLLLSMIVWVFRDIRARTTDQTSQVVAVLLVAFFNVPGLMVYLVIRPQAQLSDSYERSLEAEAILHELQLAATSCHVCRRPIDDDYVICPHCRALLREPCRSCGRHVRTTWTACPYCAVERVQQRPSPAASVPLSTPAPLQPPARRVQQQSRVETGNNGSSAASANGNSRSANGTNGASSGSNRASGNGNGTNGTSAQRGSSTPAEGASPPPAEA
jgi:hypothetical protein